jgi:hypothetical protein
LLITATVMSSSITTAQNLIMRLGGSVARSGSNSIKQLGLPYTGDKETDEIFGEP